MDFFLVVFDCIFIHFGRMKKIMKKSMEKFTSEILAQIHGSKKKIHAHPKTP